MNFRFLNISVHVAPSFWLFLIFFTELYRDISLHRILLGAILFFSLLIHEYGHAFMAQLFGARAAIILEAFGGRASYAHARFTPLQECLVALSGPLFESLLIVLPYALLKTGQFESELVTYALYATYRLNLIWCLFNLIPMLPLDGGHIARYFMERCFGQKGLKATLILGLIAAGVATPYLFLSQSPFFGALLLIFGYQSLQQLQQLKASEADSPYQTYLKGIEALNEHKIAKAQTLLKKLLKTEDEQIKTSAFEGLAKAYALKEESDKAYAMLLSANPSSLKEGKCLLCKLAFERQNYTLVAQYAHEIYSISPTYEIALLNSKSFAGLKEAEFSAAWLTTASQFEEANAEEIEKLIHTPLYQAIVDAPCFEPFKATKIMIDRSGPKPL